MRIIEVPGTLKRYCKTTWKFQQTFQTPLKDLPRFVDVVVSSLPGTTAAQAVFDNVVFAPRYGLVSLSTKYSLVPKWSGDDLIMEADGILESRDLLEALLSEWIDFYYLPTPTPIMIYADHDEYITFFAHQKAKLTRVTQSLTDAKFLAVEYVREL